jgi:RHS repeat-associated protein
MEYDAQNRLVTSGGAGIDYDADGNMLDDGTRTYEWDELGRLTSITTGTTSTGFGYSPTGERSSRDDGADRTEFLDVGPNPAVELDANGQVNAELLSGGMDQWFSRTHAGGTDAVLTDLLGSPVALGSADGTLAAEYAYDPFGATAVTGDAHGADLGFTGRQDDGTGLNYHRARYYNPELGRFISEDPIGFAGGSNLYAYAANAPTTYTDPTGNNPLLVGCIVGAGVDGGISYLTQRLSGRKVQWGQVGAAAAQGCALGMLGPLAGQILRTGRIGADAARAANDIPTIWPTNNGFAGQLGPHGNPGVTVLRPGTLVDRFGFDTGGLFVAPNGTPIGQRALAPGTTGKPYSVFEVTNRLVVQHGPAEPWFGQPGLGTQYYLPASVEDLLNAGYLRRVN